MSLACEHEEIFEQKPKNAPYHIELRCSCISRPAQVLLETALQLSMDANLRQQEVEPTFGGIECNGKILRKDDWVPLEELKKRRKERYEAEEEGLRELLNCIKELPICSERPRPLVIDRQKADALMGLPF